MLYLALAACLGWVATTCLLVWVLYRFAEGQREERQSHRIEIDACRQELTELAKAHAEQLERIGEAHRKEVANLLQRIQAPQIAVAEHVGQNTTADPPQPDLDDDEALYEIRKRERELDSLAEMLQGRAEELAAER